MKKSIPLSVPLLKGNELQYVTECIRTNWVSTAGGFVGRFEREIEGYAGVRFAVAYIPTNAHVLLPLVKDRLPAGKVRAFVELRAKGELPPPDEFLKSLLDNLDAKEDLTRQWCEQNGVPFISLTRALRDAVAAGRRAYFTYNDHWTPVGQDIAAEALLGFWQAAQSTAGSQDPGDHGDADATLLSRKEQ